MRRPHGLRWFALAFATALTLAAPTSGSESPLVAEDSVEEAVRFRTTFGFAADREMVRSTWLDSAKYSVEPYGVPLSKDEIAEMMRRAGVQQALEVVKLSGAALESYAGVYIDQHDGGRPVYMATDDGFALTRALGEQLPGGIDFRIQQAARTEAELLHLKDRIASDVDDLQEQGIEVVRIALEPSRNTLMVGVLALTTKAESTLRERYGSELVIAEDGVAQSDACVGRNDCRPIKGGIAINPLGVAANQCTTGFIVKRSPGPGLGVLTAGHCLQVFGGYDVTWQHNADSFGNARHETWKPGLTGNSDVGYITIVESVPNKNEMRRVNNSVVQVLSVATPIVGGQGCRVGLTSGHKCGVITQYPAQRVSHVDGWANMTVTKTATLNFDSTGGDSGGSVFYYSTPGAESGNVVALGTHVHSEEDGPAANESWFSPYFDARGDYLNQFGYSYLICVQTAC